MKYIKKFEDIRLADVPLVGGKNASLGQMVSQLGSRGILVPDGFAITAPAYWYYLESNQLVDKLKLLMAKIAGSDDVPTIKEVGVQVRQLIEHGIIPQDLAVEIGEAYADLSREYDESELDVAVRSSATAEDLPTASFAGQQESFLHIHGQDHLLLSYQRCLASLFTDRAIVYRLQNGFDHFKVALSVGVQKMVRSDGAAAGVAFSLDPETGFKDVVVINASYGLGETIVQGMVDPDEYMVFKPTLLQGCDAIIRKTVGSKLVKMIYALDGQVSTVLVDVPEAERAVFALQDKDILEIARATATIEDYYSGLASQWSPMDIEWAKDCHDGRIYVVQARPETVYAPAAHKVAMHYAMTGLSDQELAHRIVVTGQSIGQGMASGKVRIIEQVSECDAVQHGEILVTHMTDPDWVPAMQRAVGVITEHGGRTCHAAIVSRELGIPAIVGAAGVTKLLRTGQEVTIDCSRGKTGYIYQGLVPFEVQPLVVNEKMVTLPVPVLVNMGDPDRALVTSQLPVAGVGLARLEFIIANAIRIHPCALLYPEKVTDPKISAEITALTAAWPDKKQFFIDMLAQGIGMIAAAFYPRKVIVRLSDLKSNEYRSLLGGIYFEPEEENPMLGFRGASRYCNPAYRDAFALECAALKKVREAMGLTNVVIMVPFVRTMAEADAVRDELARNGLVRGEKVLALYMMVEIPSNVLLIEEFAQRFDGFSIGSNDLTQLTLGVDRDSQLLADLFDERDPAVKKMVYLAIEGAHKLGKTIGICGQAPSDYPEFADFLIERGIDSLSLNPDAVLPFLARLREA